MCIVLCEINISVVCGIIVAETATALSRHGIEPEFIIPLKSQILSTELAVDNISSQQY